jgi:outer membrane lipoprotein carrier protein
MNQRLPLGLLLTMALSLNTVSVTPPAVDADLCARTMATLDRSYRDFRALRAHFTHTLSARVLNQQEVEEGDLFLERGGRMRWEYSVPKGKLAVADGRDSYLYLPAEDQVFIQSLDKGGNLPLALRLLTGQVALGDEVTCLSALAASGEVVVQLQLKKPQPEVQHLEATVDLARREVSEVRYQDALGNENVLTLTDIKRLDALPGNLFEFRIPPGAKVIRAD